MLIEMNMSPEADAAGSSAEGGGGGGGAAIRAPLSLPMESVLPFGPPLFTKFMRPIDKQDLGLAKAAVG